MRKNKMSVTSTFDGLMVTSKSSTALTAPASSPACSSQGQVSKVSAESPLLMHWSR